MIVAPAVAVPAALPPGPDADLGDTIADDLRATGGLRARGGLRATDGPGGRVGPGTTVGPGAAVAGSAEFEAAFRSVVEGSAPTPELAWDRFYDRTLARVAIGWEHAPRGTEVGGTVATFTRIWARAARLAVGPQVLDVGCCFGFLPLAWSRLPAAPAVTACDVSAGCVDLAARQSRRLGWPVRWLRADATALPFGTGTVGTVTLIHLLEHLDVAAAAAALREAVRVARRRVVVAVPLEAVPDPIFGHVQGYDLGALAALGAATGLRATVSEADGGWLVLDAGTGRRRITPARACRRGRRPPRGG